MFNLVFISHFYAVVIRIIQTFEPKMRCFETQNAMLPNSRLDATTLAAWDAITQLNIL